jgi:tagatose 6-phosphate kinase
VEYRRLLGSCSAVVCAGSLPAGLPADAYASLIAAAHDQGRSVVLDSSGEALRFGLEAKPDVLKFNRAELEGLAGRTLPDERSVIDWADRVDGTAIVTLGVEGAIAAGTGWRYRIRPPRRQGNPVGAGDAFTAGLVCDAVATAPPAQRLAFAAALAASAVGLPCAGMVDLDVTKQLVADVKVEVL